MVRGLTPLYFPCNGNTEKGAFSTFYDEITLLNVVKYTCYQADDFKRSDRATFPIIVAAYAQNPLYKRNPYPEFIHRKEYPNAKSNDH